ncbi:MAG: beta-xylosidase [Armatimonadetes bacterium]|nr:beta-xylosidase [Armatimonadota bacterium]
MPHVATEPVGPPLLQPWKRGVAMGRAFEILRADAQSHIRLVQQEIGFESCRFHGLFHDDVGVAVRGEDGKLRFQWGHVDRIFDFLLSVGLRPFVELGPMPAALASGKQTFFHWHMNVTPPADFEEWRLLVSEFAKHCVARYGLSEVRQWHFEVWNEPNLDAFWSGTQEEYWRLYTVAAEALKAVDTELKVGGPASAEALWIPDFLDYLRSSGAPCDFVSTHAYPQNEFANHPSRAESPHAPGMYFVDTVRRVRQQVQNWGGKPLELHFTEWSSLDAGDKDGVDWYANETIDQLYGAALVCHVCTQLDRDTDSLFWWVASDIFEEMGMPQSPFSNNFGMVTVDGWPKATFHAFRLLNRMRGPVVLQHTDPDLPTRGLVATRDGANTHILAWNHVPIGLPHGSWLIEVALPTGPEGGLATVCHVREGAGSAYEPWVAMGRPQNPTPAQQEALKAMSQPSYSTHALNPDGDTLRIDLAPGEIWWAEVAGPPDPYVLKGVETTFTDAVNAALSAIPTS